MKRHAFLSFVLLCSTFCLFSQKKEKADKWIKNTFSISYDERIEDMAWFPASLHSNTDSIKELDLKLIKIGYLVFTKSGNFHEFEISDFSIGFKRRELINYEQVLGMSFSTIQSKIFNLHITPKWQFNYKISDNKSKNKIFIGAGWQPFYQHEILNPVNSSAYPQFKRKKIKFGSYFMITPRILFIKNDRFVLDIGFSKTIHKFQRIIQDHEHGVPNRPEKFTHSTSDILPIDFELNVGIGIKLNSNKQGINRKVRGS